MTGIRNQKTFEAITVTNAKAYLLSKGWLLAETFADKSFIFRKDGFKPLILPQQESFGDYGLRMLELVGVLGDVEQREALSIVNDIKLSGFDTFFVRLSDNTADGTIPFNSTKTIIEEAKVMLVSAAAACVDAKKIIPAKKTKEVDTFIQKVRLGQSRKGSYIFTLLTPIAPDLTPVLPMFVDTAEETLFDRRVTTMLNRALHATSIALDSTKKDLDLTHFESAVVDGVSANFCEAISNIAREAGQTSFSISLSANRPSAITDTSEVSFSLLDVEILEEVVRTYRLVNTRTETILSGYVYALDKDKADPLGNVQMKAVIDGKLKTVQLALGDEDYAKAIAAHEAWKTINVEGDLIQRGKFKVLENIKRFTVLDGDEI